MTSNKFSFFTFLFFLSFQSNFYYEELADSESGAKHADLVINGILHDLSPKKNRYVGYKYLFLKNTNKLVKKKDNKKK